MSKCQKSHDRDNSWCDCGSTGRRARGGRISKAQQREEPKSHRMLFFPSIHNSNDCFHRTESAAAPTESPLKHSGIVGGVQGCPTVLTANVTIQRAMNQLQYEFWVDDSGATEYVTQDTADLKITCRRQRDRRERRLFIDFSGPFHKMCLGNKAFVMLYFGDFTIL